MIEKAEGRSGPNAGRAAPLLAADVGGTHARLALVAPHGGGYVAAAFEKYACAEYPSLAAIIEAFRRRHAADADRLALAIAGYVVDDIVVNPSLPWRVSIPALREALRLRHLAVVNDFEAAAHAVAHVAREETTLIAGPPAAPTGPALIVGPGTGLGAALRIPHAGGELILATEAGQATLAPDSDLEFELLRELRRRGTRVIAEDVLSGGGLAALYAALRALRSAPPLAMAPAAITAAALARTDAHAVEAVEVFLGWLGSALGDLVLVYGATGGVYLAGGVLPRMLDLLRASRFAARFADKGAMREVLARTPVRLVDRAELGVIGAAHWYFGRYVDEGRAAGAASGF